MPLAREDSFELLCKSGKDILSWRQQTSDLEKGLIEWKQSIWSLTGTAVIIARLEKTEENQTTVIVDIHKPFQFIDPLNLCGRIFKTLETSVEKHYSLLKETMGSTDPPSHTR
jgi:hypothetical protein